MNNEAELILAIAEGVVYNQNNKVASSIKNNNIGWVRLKEGLAYHEIAAP